MYVYKLCNNSFNAHDEACKEEETGGGVSDEKFVFVTKVKFCDSSKTNSGTKYEQKKKYQSDS